MKYAKHNIKEISLEEISFPKCQQLCQNNEKCLGYSYKHDGSCQLKSKLENKQVSLEGRASAPKYCPIHGNWTDFETWLPCKNGEQKGFRYCTNPEPEHGGDDCEGDIYTYKNCTMLEGKYRMTLPIS